MDRREESGEGFDGRTHVGHGFDCSTIIYAPLTASLSAPAHLAPVATGVYRASTPCVQHSTRWIRCLKSGSPFNLLRLAKSQAIRSIVSVKSLCATTPATPKRRTFTSLTQSSTPPTNTHENDILATRISQPIRRIYTLNPMGG